MATAMKEPTLGRRVKIQPKGPICSRSSAEIAIESTSVHACSLHTKQKSQVGVHTPPAKPTLPTELNSTEPNQTEVNSTDLNATFAQSNLRLRNSFFGHNKFSACRLSILQYTNRKRGSVRFVRKTGKINITIKFNFR